MEPIKDILFATDLSRNSDNALRHALRMARAHAAKLHVLHVTEPLSSDAVVTLQLFMQDETARSRAIKERHQAVRELLKENQRQFLNSLPAEEKAAYDAVVSVELADGHPAEVILTRAQDLNCGLIVMATHAEHTRHTFIGSVVKRVLRRSPIPTLVVPHLA